MKAAESRTLITINLTLCIILQFDWQLQSQSLSQQLSWRSQLERYKDKTELFKEYYKMSHISAMKWQSAKSLFATLEASFIRTAHFIKLFTVLIYERL